MSLHRINLKGPWKFEWIEPPGDSGRLRMPAEWREAFGDRAGTVRWTRRFHEPTGLEPGDRVWLVFEGIGGRARLALDGQLLGTAECGGIARFEIADRLELTNTLVAEITFDPAADVGPGGLFGVVALEIESADETEE